MFTQSAQPLRSSVERNKTRLDHVWEIRDADGWREFSEVETELGAWVEGRAWTTGDRPKALFDGAVGWPRDRRVLLMEVTGATDDLFAAEQEGVKFEPVSLSQVWEQIEAVVPHEQITQALLDIVALAGTADEDADAAWRAELVKRYPTVRPFLLLCQVTGELSLSRAWLDVDHVSPGGYVN